MNDIYELNKNEILFFNVINITFKNYDESFCDYIIDKFNIEKNVLDKRILSKRELIFYNSIIFNYIILNNKYFLVLICDELYIIDLIKCIIIKSFILYYGKILYWRNLNKNKAFLFFNQGNFTLFQFEEKDISLKIIGYNYILKKTNDTKSESINKEGNNINYHPLIKDLDLLYNINLFYSKEKNFINFY